MAGRQPPRRSASYPPHSNHHHHHHPHTHTHTRRTDTPAPDDAAARTLIVFDGEKREQAHATYRKVKGRIAAAVFDDSNRAFRAGTIEPSKDPFVDTEGGQMHDRVGGRTMELSMLEKMDAWAKAPSRVWSRAHNYSKAHFEKSHFIIVQAGRFAAAAATSGTGYRGRDLAR